MAQSLRDTLLTYTTKGELYKKEGESNALRCFACGHRCFIPEGRDGICKVRANVGGELRVPWGYVGAVQLDPIEKKPFFHVTPGAKALSFGMLGCDFHCAYCQNWYTSQSLRDPASTALPEKISATDLCEIAIDQGAIHLTSTYNEPLITSEWAVEVFKEGKKRGLRNSFVSNGNATPEVLNYIRPYVDYYKIDLKSFDDKHYRQLGGVLQNILDSIRRVYELGFWLEIVTLVIPGFNDNREEIKKMCAFLVSVSPTIPLHLTAFHQDYKMRDHDKTSADGLLGLSEIAVQAGLKFVYVGNLPGQVGKWENTYCPNCKAELVTRFGFRIIKNALKTSKCPFCNVTVPGVWA